jgi:drug/metabolite transporter (DMT)-like permease
MALIGWAGGYVLGRAVGMRPLEAAGCATTFAGSSSLFLHVAAGKQRITLEYRDHWFAAGVLIFLLTAGAAGVVAWSERRGRGGFRPGAS